MSDSVSFELPSPGDGDTKEFDIVRIVGEEWLTPDAIIDPADAPLIVPRRLPHGHASEGCS